MNQNSLLPITSVIQSLLYVQSLSLFLKQEVELPHLQMKPETSSPHPQKDWKKKKKGFQSGELFFKYTKYFSSFLVLGKSCNFL